MSLIKKVSIDKIEILENGIIQIREATCIYEDGVELSKQYHRSSFEPGDDVSNQPENVQSICDAAWTPEIISAYKAQQEANKLKSAQLV